MTDNKIAYATDTFHNLTNDKQNKIIKCALSVFSQKGYDLANVNTIAELAGISVGSLYKYFSSKEDLYLGIVDSGEKILLKVLSKAEKSDNIIDFFEGMLRASREFADEYPEYNQLYLDIVARCGYNAKLLCHRIEGNTAESYRRLISVSKKNGIIKSDLQDGIISWMLDDLVMMFQFSTASQYYRERMLCYTGINSAQNSDEIIKQMVDFVRKALS